MIGIEYRLPGDLAGSGAAGLAHQYRLDSRFAHPLR
jgi:hypothetical protein